MDYLEGVLMWKANEGKVFVFWRRPRLKQFIDHASRLTYRVLSDHKLTCQLMNYSSWLIETEFTDSVLETSPLDVQDNEHTEPVRLSLLQSH